MIVHCLSPNPKCTSNSKCHHQIKRCNCSSGCICLTNYCSPCSNKKNLKIDVEPKKEIKQRVTYEIDSKENFSPIPPLKKNQSMLYQNISPVIPLKKTNSLFNIREKNYNENKINVKETPKNFVTNSQNMLSKCNSMNYSRKNKPCINKNLIRNNINKKKELMAKIRYISNKIDETINLYKGKKYINPNNNENNEMERKSCINKYNELPLNFQYNNSRILENMRKENEKQTDLMNLKIKNVSQIENNPINIYKRICNNNNQDSKKIKVNYAKLNKQKKFYIDNNINLNKINDNKINNEDISNYYRNQKRKENLQQIYRYSEPFINGYNHKQENIFNRCCPCKNKKIRINNEQLTYIRNNSFDESINTKKNNYFVIKNLKKNMYEKEFSNRDVNRNDYNTEKNRHKRNKSKSQYIYTMRNINEKYDNNYYKEIVHKKRENSSINNDSLIEIRNNKSVDMNKNFVINRENSENNKVFERNNSYDYKKNRRKNYNLDNYKINEINYRIINNKNNNENKNENENEMNDYNGPLYNRISRNERYQNNLNDINRENNYNYNYNEENVNQENMRENNYNGNEEMNYQGENNNIENNYPQEEMENNINNKICIEDDINMDENNNYFENQNKENNINNENINYEEEEQNQNLNEDLNNKNINYDYLEKRNNELLEENESLKKSLDNCLSSKSEYESHIADLEQKLIISSKRNKELELNNNKLLSELNACKNQENKYNLIQKENSNYIEDNQKLLEIIKRKEKDFEKIKSINDENQSNFDSLLLKHNNLLDKYNNLNKENKQIKNEFFDLQQKYEKLGKDLDETKIKYNRLTKDDNNNINKYNKLINDYKDISNKYEEDQNKYVNLKKQNEKLVKLNEEKDKNISDLYEKNEINQRKIENLNNKIILLTKEKNEEIKKYNNINTTYKEVTKKVNILESKLKENDLELNNNKMESNKNINNLIQSNNKYKEEYNKLYNELIQIQEELNRLKEENESLLNKNISLSNDNENMLKEREYNNELLSSYKESLDKLNQEIFQLKIENEKYKKENNDLKNKLKSGLNRSHNSAYEDEIIIVNKETIYSKGVLSEPNEFNKYGEIKNKYDIKKNAEVNANEILKYHEIIQDLTNMILIYEKFFFKEKIKPKNNQELFCYLIVQYINEKIRKIKSNVFMNLLIYKESKPMVRYIKKNNTNFKETKYGKNISGFSDKNTRKNIGYFSEQKQINNNEE